MNKSASSHYKQWLASSSACILFGNPNNKRTAGWQQAREHHHLSSALVVPYIRILHSIRAGESLDDLLQAVFQRQTHQRDPIDGKESNTGIDICLVSSQVESSLSHQPSLLLRLDAPGDHFAVERELIALGAVDAEGDIDDVFVPLDAYTVGASISATAARRLQPQHGRIWYPAQWFRGYCRLLSWLQREVSLLLPQAKWMNDPAEIAIMFDKRRCHQWLHTAGVAVPPLVPDLLGKHTSYEQLRQRMQHHRIHRVFIKLFCGSAASGVIAYQYNPRTGAEIATTTIGIDNSGSESYYYNSGKLRRYTESATIAQIIDWVGQEGMHAERWISKDSWQNKAYDVRQLVCRYEAGHAVMRLSHTPITNLHLRNERLLVEQSHLLADQISAIEQTARAGLQTFPYSFCAGIDVLVPSGGGQPYIIDMNPFGDLLYHVEHRGLGTYAWELQQWLEHEGE
ncbi:STM4014 family protein [Paenibacillus nicotianae]|uniref:STM4014 family protein n=1 Tax=Paenibacillus nicotianae TaxID=1526551 RepID=A0ABW4UR11_9BACL